MLYGGINSTISPRRATKKHISVYTWAVLKMKKRRRKLKERTR